MIIVGGGLASLAPSAPVLKNAQNWAAFAKNATSAQTTGSTPALFEESFEKFRKDTKEKEAKQKQLKNEEMAKRQQRDAERIRLEQERQRERQREQERMG